MLTSLSETIITVFVGFCPVSTVSRHVRCTQKEHIHIHKVVADLVVFLKEEDLVVQSGYFGRISTMSTMNDCEEDLDGFPAENKEKPVESMVGAHRAESTDQKTAGSGSRRRFHLSLMDLTSWEKYEELIDDWLDLTVLEAEKNEAQH